MQDILRPEPYPAAPSRVWKFQEPLPNRKPLHLLLLIIGLPVAILTLFFALLAKPFASTGR